MSEVQTSSSVIIQGPFQMKREHSITNDFLQASINSYMAVGNRIAYDMISDESVRRQYQSHIKIISEDIRATVASGEMTPLEGAKFCNQIRDKLFVEYRRYTSAQGVAAAEEIKLKAKEFDFYLNKYAKGRYNRQFIDLSESERAAVYYDVISASGRDNAKVTTKSVRLMKQARSMVLITGAVAVWEITDAKNHVKEAARQGNIIAAGMIGGGVAGGAVSFLCGPAEPVCAYATVTIGANLGGMAGSVITDLWDEGLQFFKSFVWN
ncbi:hypothetical protein [Paraburkholderia sp. ZP32-5]|uniref:hypothetical protein n=1 Tax=Paraburkholderia sp. ZP32-5 TaxID=2883245 RepID=UPI001F2A11A4|nr:hypothetical protein [Paraburkholderia sp. ZP32-5]